jgi:Protein of unknown function (DUF3667)
MADIAHSADHQCPNCGHKLAGAFCANCGQAAHDGHPPTIGHFLHDLLHESLHVDGTIFRTLKALFLQPGKLTEEYWAGHIVSWIRPIRLFLVVAALHLLISTGIGPLNFKVGVNRSPHGDLAFSFTSNGGVTKLPAGSVPVPEATRREFLEKFEKVYHEVRYLSVLIFALAVWLLYRREQPYFVANLILALHFFSFWYALAIVANLGARWQEILQDLSFLTPVYLFLMLRHLFHERWYVRLGKTVLLYGFLLATELSLVLAAGSWASRGAHQ